MTFTTVEPFPRERLTDAYEWHKWTTTCLNGRDHTCAEFIRIMAGAWGKAGARSWGIYGDGELVGMVFFEPIWRGGELVDGSVHISLARSAWGKGAIQAAAEEILPALFAQPTLTRLSGFTPSHYKPGIAVALALGFSVEGVIVDAVHIQGRLRSITTTGLTRQQWEKGRS